MSGTTPSQRKEPNANANVIREVPGLDTASGTPKDVKNAHRILNTKAELERSVDPATNIQPPEDIQRILATVEKTGQVSDADMKKLARWVRNEAPRNSAIGAIQEIWKRKIRSERSGSLE